jgi:hypothetical protein
MNDHKLHFFLMFLSKNPNLSQQRFQQAYQTPILEYYARNSRTIIDNPLSKDSDPQGLQLKTWT